MSTFLSILLIAIIIAIVILGILGWCFKWLWALIGFSWEGISSIGCFVRFWIYFLILAFVIALLGKMVS